MATIHRFLLENRCYHTITATQDRRPLFARACLAQTVVNALDFVSEDKAHILAYAVVPNHLHVVLVPRSPHTVASVMQSIKGYSAREMNKALGRRERLWQPSYYDRVIRTEKHLRNTVDYVEWNPVTAQLAKTPDAYPYSSARRNVDRDLDAWFADDRG